MILHQLCVRICRLKLAYQTKIVGIYFIAFFLAIYKFIISIEQIKMTFEWNAFMFWESHTFKNFEVLKEIYFIWLDLFIVPFLVETEMVKGEIPESSVQFALIISLLWNIDKRKVAIYSTYLKALFKPIAFVVEINSDIDLLSFFIIFNWFPFESFRHTVVIKLLYWKTSQKRRKLGCYKIESKEFFLGIIHL